MDAQYPIRGIHHITLVSGDAERAVRFYVDTLGLRFVKKTVNFDKPDIYHLYFGNQIGLPGTLVTIFSQPGADPGYPGIGTVRHFALTVGSPDALLKWKTYLVARGFPVAGPYQHPAYSNIVFVDPDGTELELATSGPGWKPDQSPDEVYVPPVDQRAPFWDIDDIEARRWPEPVSTIEPDMRIQGIHHLGCMGADLTRTDSFYQEILGIPRLFKTVDEGSPDMPRWYWSSAGGRPGTIITYVALPDDAKPVVGQVGRGTAHHFAFEVDSDDALQHWRQHLAEHGLNVTGVRDRKYFRCIYFDDPDGVRLEIATKDPGVLVDETEDTLGQELSLPDWLEPKRQDIESKLPKIGPKVTVPST